MEQSAIILVLSCLGVAQALFISAYLILKRDKDKKANIFLALALLGLTIRIGKSVLNVYLDLEPWQRNLGISGILLCGPFIWLYGKELFSPVKSFSLKNYFHIVPFFAMALGCYFIPNNRSLTALIIYVAVFIHMAFYIGFSAHLYFTMREKVHKQRAEWYRNLLIGFALIWLFYMGNLVQLFSYYIGGAIFFSLLMYVFSFLFLQKHAFRLGKYNASTMDSSSSKKIMKDLKLLFQTEEVFLESTLSIKSVAEKLSIDSRKLSQAINENEGKNFSDYVNSFRINKAKTLLEDKRYQHEKIITIAYDCGFGNITSFNLAFKAKTNLTPSQYRKKHTID